MGAAGGGGLVAEAVPAVAAEVEGQSHGVRVAGKLGLGQRVQGYVATGGRGCVCVLGGGKQGNGVEFFAGDAVEGVDGPVEDDAAVLDGGLTPGVVFLIAGAQDELLALEGGAQGGCGVGGLLAFLGLDGGR